MKIKKSLLFIAILLVSININLIDSQIDYKFSEEKNFKYITLADLTYNNTLDISYLIDNSKIIGEFVSVDIWILNSSLDEVKKIKEEVNINKGSPVKKNLQIDFTPEINKEYEIYLAFSENNKEFIKYTFSLMESQTKESKFHSIKTNYLLIIPGAIIIISIIYLTNRFLKRKIKSAIDDNKS